MKAAHQLTVSELHDTLCIDHDKLLRIGALCLQGNVSLQPSNADIWVAWTPGSVTSIVSESQQPVLQFHKTKSRRNASLPGKKASSKQTRSQPDSSLQQSSAAFKGKQRVSEVPPPSCEDIDFLVTHAFLHCEWKQLDSQKVIVRVCAIPLDTPGLNSKLHQAGLRDLRSGSKRRTAEAALKRVFHHARLDMEACDSLEPAEEYRPVLARNPVGD